MKRTAVTAALACALLVACGGGSASLSDRAAAELRPEVSEVKTAAAARDPDSAARALAKLRASVTALRRDDQISSVRARAVLAAAADVEANLVAITTTTTTTTTPTTRPPAVTRPPTTTARPPATTRPPIATVPLTEDDRGPGKGKGNGKEKG